MLVFNIIGTSRLLFPHQPTRLVRGHVVKALNTLSSEALKDDFLPMMTKSVLAGWLIALMVWLIPGAGQARLWLIVVVTYVVSIAHFSHIIAGSVEASYGVFVGHITFASIFPVSWFQH